MIKHSESIYALSFNPSTDFELWALESELNEAEAELLSAEEALINIGGFIDHESASLESFFDDMFEVATESDKEGCECDDENEDDDKETDDEEVSEEAAIACFAFEAATENFATKLKNFWVALKNKFMLFLKKITESVANMTRNVQIKIASTGMKDSDEVRVSKDVWGQAEYAIKNSGKLFGTIDKVLGGTETVANLKKIYEAIKGQHDAAGASGDLTTVKFSVVKSHLKELSGMLKQANIYVKKIDQFVSKKGTIDLSGDASSASGADVKQALMSCIDGMTTLIRSAFSGLIGALKATKAEKKAGVDESRKLRGSKDQKNLTKKQLNDMQKAAKKDNDMRKDAAIAFGGKVED